MATTTATWLSYYYLEPVYIQWSELVSSINLEFEKSTILTSPKIWGSQNMWLWNNVINKYNYRHLVVLVLAIFSWSKLIKYDIHEKSGIWGTTYLQWLLILVGSKHKVINCCSQWQSQGAAGSPFLEINSFGCALWQHVLCTVWNLGN